MARKVGDRVGAVLSRTNDVINLIGYGVYEGDFVPTPDVAGWMADALREGKVPNPRIALDDGKGHVWGCECWWGGEEAIRASLVGKVVNVVDMKEVRERVRAEEAKQVKED